MLREWTVRMLRGARGRPALPLALALLCGSLSGPVRAGSPARSVRPVPAADSGEVVRLDVAASERLGPGSDPGSTGLVPWDDAERVSADPLLRDYPLYGVASHFAA